MMRKILCISLLSMIIVLVGCGGPAASQVFDDISSEQSKGLSESSSAEDSCEPSGAEVVSDCSSDDSYDISSDTSDIYSEVEVDFTEFE